jgi:ankyrin repeat protein
LELLEAVNADDGEKVRDLLLRKANISTMNSDQQTPLDLATAKGHTAMVKLLCSHGADANSALVLAVNLGKEASLRMLIENGADINLHMIMKLGGETKRHTALYLAAYNGDERIASVLLEKGADTNPHDLSSWNRNETALHIAARMGEGITRILLEGNADVEAKDSSGCTPLSYAIGRGSKCFWKSRSFNEVTTKLLLEAGATVSLKDWYAMPLCFREQNAKYAPTVSLEDWDAMPLCFDTRMPNTVQPTVSPPLAPRLLVKI